MFDTEMKEFNKKAKKHQLYGAFVDITHSVG